MSGPQHDENEVAFGSSCLADVAWLAQQLRELGVSLSHTDVARDGDVEQRVVFAVAPQLLDALLRRDEWMWRLSGALSSVLLAGARRRSLASSTECVIDTESAAVRDELMRVALHAGCAAQFGWHDNGNVWRVCYSAMVSVAQPTLHRESNVRHVQYEGSTWCVTLPHGFIVARRARANSDGECWQQAHTHTRTLTHLLHQSTTLMLYVMCLQVL